MIQCDVLTLENKPSGKVDLSESIFGVEVRTDILHRMVKWQLAKRQSGTHKVKERGEVRGSTAKIYRQKGTGRARHGSKKVSQFVGGGVTKAAAVAQLDVRARRRPRGVLRVRVGVDGDGAARVHRGGRGAVAGRGRAGGEAAARGRAAAGAAHGRRQEHE